MTYGQQISLSGFFCGVPGAILEQRPSGGSWEKLAELTFAAERAGLTIMIERREGTRWRAVATAVTDPDGGFRAAPQSALAPLVVGSA